MLALAYPTVFFAVRLRKNSRRLQSLPQLQLLRSHRPRISFDQAGQRQN